MDKAFDRTELRRALRRRGMCASMERVWRERKNLEAVHLFSTPPASGATWSGERTSDYGGVKQRWLIIESDAARTRSLERQHKELKRLEQALNKELRALKRRSFHCEADARAAVAAFETKLKLHRLDKVSVRVEKRYLQPGRPSAETPFELSYRVHTDHHLTRGSKRAASAFIAFHPGQQRLHPLC